MKLSIIIPTKDRPQLIGQTLSAIYEAIQGIDSEIILVNDSVHPVQLPQMMASFVQVLQNPKTGVASARNFGAQQAKGELLLFMDDDMLIKPENVHTTLALHQQYQKCCINLNWIYPPEQIKRIQKYPFGRYLIHYGFTSLKGWNRGNYWNDDELFATNGITSQYLSISKKDFWASGGYNEMFPYAGFEDYEFGKRLQQQGITFYIYPLSRLFHNEADRLDIRAWLDRRWRGGRTRKVAAGLGYSEVVLVYPFWKKQILCLLKLLRPIFLFIIAKFPEMQSIDPIRFRLINLLLATAIFEGYTSPSTSNDN